MGDDLFLFSNKARVFTDKKFGSELFAEWFYNFCVTVDRLLPAICETGCRQYGTYWAAVERFNSLKEVAKKLDAEMAGFNQKREKKKKNQSIIALPGLIETYTEFWCLACVEKALLIGF